MTATLLRVLCLVTLCALTARAPTRARAQEAPISLPTTISEPGKQKEVEYRNGTSMMVRNVAKPTLWPYLPDKEKRNGTAIVICPGGGFHFLSWDSEGVAVARWLQERGVCAFVLRYRLIDTGVTEEEFKQHVDQLFGRPGAPVRTPEQERERREIPALAIADGKEAMIAVRRRATELGIDPHKIGIMGFSAGAVVVMGVVMDRDQVGHPDFAAPIYGGGTGGAPVPRDAPPLFLLVATDDKPNALSSAKLYSQWREADRPAELHIYSKGGHGFGMNKRGMPVDSWIDRFGDWLGVQSLVPGKLTPKVE